MPGEGKRLVYCPMFKLTDALAGSLTPSVPTGVIVN